MFLFIVILFIYLTILFFIIKNNIVRLETKIDHKNSIIEKKYKGIDINISNIEKQFYTQINNLTLECSEISKTCTSLIKNLEVLTEKSKKDLIKSINIYHEYNKDNNKNIVNFKDELKNQLKKYSNNYEKSLEKLNIYFFKFEKEFANLNLNNDKLKKNGNELSNKIETLNDNFYLILEILKGIWANELLKDMENSILENNIQNKK